MEIKTFKIFSYCNDFVDREDLQDIIARDRGYDSYIEWTAYTEETMKSLGYNNNEVSNKLIELGANDKEVVLIHLDW